MATDSRELRPPPAAIVPESNRAKILIAPWWHTLILIALLLGASYGQANSLGPLVARHGRLPLYVSSMVVEWLVVVFIWLGIRRRRVVTMRELIGGRWRSPEDFLLDIAIAGLAWLLFFACAGALAYAMHLMQPEKIRELRRGIDFLVPRSLMETLVFVGLSVTAGFCEELIFRGYFQRQFSIATGSLAIGVVVQAALFGGGHGYEGWQRMVIIAVMGIVLGALAAWRRSLRPGMMMHAGQDILAGIFSRFVPQ